MSNQEISAITDNHLPIRTDNGTKIYKEGKRYYTERKEVEDSDTGEPKLVNRKKVFLSLSALNEHCTEILEYV